MKPLSDEEKSAALHRHALMRGMRVDAGLVRYLLTHGRRDLPSLMAVLDSLDRATLEQQRPATLPLLKEVMQLQFDNDKKTMNLVLFDLDNTLLAGDSDFEWAQFLISKGVLDREVHEARNLEFYEQYKAGTLDIHAFLDFQLAPLARHPRAELDAWHDEFMATHIRPLIGAAARALVQRHLDDGSLSPSSPPPTASSPAPSPANSASPTWSPPSRHRRTAASPASRAARPSFKAGKIERVEAWLEAMGLWWGSFEQSWFYSDSLNDLPLLAKVSAPRGGRSGRHAARPRPAARLAGHQPTIGY